MDLKQPSTIVAIYGAVVATLVAVVQTVDVFRRRPSLKVSGYVTTVNDGKKKTSKTTIMVRNAGRRSITVAYAGVLYGKKSSQVSTDVARHGSTGPVYLPDNKAVYYELPQETLLAHQTKCGHKITGVFCEVASGKLYKGKIKTAS